MKPATNQVGSVNGNTTTWVDHPPPGLWVYRVVLSASPGPQQFSNDYLLASHATPAMDGNDTRPSFANAPATISNGPDGMGGPICSRNTAAKTNGNPYSPKSTPNASIAGEAYVEADGRACSPASGARRRNAESRPRIRRTRSSRIGSSIALM